MTGQLTEDYLDEIFEAFNAQDGERIASYFAEDGVFRAPLGPAPYGNAAHGRQQIKEFLAARWKKFPDLSWKDPVSFISGNRAVTAWKVTWTDEKGAKNEWAGCDLYEFDGLKIKVKDTYWKRPAT